MKRVVLVFPILVLAAGLLSVAFGSATPSPSKGAGASSSAPVGTWSPPAPLLPPTAPSFQEMLATAENEALTASEKRGFISRLEGQRVVDWQGIVSDARPFFDAGIVNVDLPGGASRDIRFSVSREELANFNKQQCIKLSGRIELVTPILESFSLTLYDVTYELGPVPPTSTPPPTNTPSPTNTPPPTSTPRPTNTPAPTDTIGPTDTVPPRGGARTATAKFNANLRAGPGVSFAVVGGVPAGTALEIVARTSARDWYLLSTGAWIAAQLVNRVPDVPVAEVIPTPKTSPSSTLTPARPPRQAHWFGNGTWIIGTDVTPGTYRSMGGSGCYWERLKGFGGTVDEIIVNDRPNGPAVVTIAATDKGFRANGCNHWTADLSPITSSSTAPFGDGTFLVNKDIAPGSWRSSGGGNCYWKRLRGFSGELDDIMADDKASGSAVVTIAPGDAGFSSSGCGTWTKIE